MTYAGDVPPEEAWRLLQEDKTAQLVDVRSDAEWTFVGLPDLSAAGKKAALIAWQLFPRMERNGTFEADVAAQFPDKATPLFFLCRSGARSRSAAIAMTALGYSHCYNIADGFEGVPDGARHRGKLSGWKARGLPWLQS